MRVADWTRLIVLLTRITYPKLLHRVDKSIRVRENLVAPGGVLHDCYEPLQNPRACVIAVHGASLNGKEDPRLEHFARCLAASGVSCVTPNLAGLAGLRWLPSDVEGLVDLIDHHSQRQNVGLVGFSFGASYALVAAARAPVASRVGYVIAFGAYHFFPDLHAFYLSRQGRPPDSDSGWDDWIYLHLVLAFRHAEQLELGETTVHAIESLLRRYCHEIAIQEKLSFYKKYLDGRDLIRVEADAQDRTSLARISPAGQLRGLKCHIGLLHDPDDNLVPVQQAKSLAEELEACGGSHRLHITPLLSHISPSRVPNPWDLYQILRMLVPLVKASSTKSCP